MNYQKEILTKLLQKYEDSKAFKEGGSNRKIAVSLEKEGDLSARFENIDEKKDFLSALQDLKEQGLIDYSWVKYEQGNLVERFWLLTDSPLSLAEAYRAAGLIPLKEQIGICQRQLEDLLKRVTKEWIKLFLSKSLVYINSRKKLPRAFKNPYWQDLIKALEALDQVEGEALERVFSAQIYDDSKHFEKHVKSNLLSVLRQAFPQSEGEQEEDEELLRLAGISRYPEVMEFTGQIEVVLKNGKSVIYSEERYGAYINSYLIKEVAAVNLAKVKRVLFIENKANYIWYILNCRKDDELVLFHGGFYSPMKGQWFRKIYRYAKSDKTSFWHWSDIDLGGFRIFCRLKREIITGLRPYKMDVDTYKSFAENGKAIQKESYRSQLSELLELPEYQLFHEVIEAMLVRGTVVEQEIMI